MITIALQVAKKLKDWFAVWSNCALKDGTVIISATVYLTNRLCFEEKTEEEVADILGHLMKEKEISPKQMEQAISSFKVNNKDLNLILGHLLTFIYPTPKGDFGWSRVGWGFAQWWGQGKKFIKDLDRPVDCLKV